MLSESPIFAGGVGVVGFIKRIHVEGQRGVSLGDSVELVVDRLKLDASDVKVVHKRSSLAQEVTVRRTASSAAPVSTPPPR